MEVDRPSNDIADITRDLRKPAGEAPETPEDKASVSATVAASGESPSTPSAPKVQENRKRCFNCTKKVGLTGLECKCGYVFCSKHR